MKQFETSNNSAAIHADDNDDELSLIAGKFANQLEVQVSSTAARFI